VSIYLNKKHFNCYGNNFNYSKASLKAKDRRERRHARFTERNAHVEQLFSDTSSKLSFSGSQQRAPKLLKTLVITGVVLSILPALLMSYEASSVCSIKEKNVQKNPHQEAPSTFSLNPSRVSVKKAAIYDKSGSRERNDISKLIAANQDQCLLSSYNASRASGVKEKKPHQEAPPTFSLNPSRASVKKATVYNKSGNRDGNDISKLIATNQDQCLLGSYNASRASDVKKKNPHQEVPSTFSLNPSRVSVEKATVYDKSGNRDGNDISKLIAANQDQCLLGSYNASLASDVKKKNHHQEVPSTFSLNSSQVFVEKTPEKKIEIATVYDNSGNRDRDDISKLVTANHDEYAKIHGMEHRISSDNLVKNSCKDLLGREDVDCAPYWNKIQLIREWFFAPKRSQSEEWLIFADDDMVVTNLKVDPSSAIDQLRQGDESVVIVQDIQNWQAARFPSPIDPRMSVNTGLIIVRKDELAKEFIEKIWELRHDLTGLRSAICFRLGTCKNQDCLHEQEAAAKVLREDPSLLNRVVSVPLPREAAPSLRVAANTFYREGCFVRYAANGRPKTFDYSGDQSNPLGAFRFGDWMAQASGIPIRGKVISRSYIGFYCTDDPITLFKEPKEENIGFPRKEYIEDLLKQVQR
jgi:hypothetical protein